MRMARRGQAKPDSVGIFHLAKGVAAAPVDRRSQVNLAAAARGLAVAEVAAAPVDRRLQVDQAAAVRGMVMAQAAMSPVVRRFQVDQAAAVSELAVAKAEVLAGSRILIPVDRRLRVALPLVMANRQVV